MTQTPIYINFIFAMKTEILHVKISQILFNPKDRHADSPFALKTLLLRYHSSYWVGDNLRCYQGLFYTRPFQEYIAPYLPSLSVQPPLENQLPLNILSLNTRHWPRTGAPCLLTYWITPNSIFLSLRDQIAKYQICCLT